MVSLLEIKTVLQQPATRQEFVCSTALNLYKAPDQDSLVTQATPGRQLTCQQISNESLPDSSRQTFSVLVQLCEDDYEGWLRATDLQSLVPAVEPYCPVRLDRATIASRLPQIIQFAQTARVHPNQYLWGGTVGPHYDCSGLMQAAFASAGIWLPRDAYQQAAFTQVIPLDQAEPGDLLFFGRAEPITHVALYLGGGQYLHSSGAAQGRNGIGIDSLADLTHPVSATYARQFKSVGRVMHSYVPSRISGQSLGYQAGHGAELTTASEGKHWLEAATQP